MSDSTVLVKLNKQTLLRAGVVLFLALFTVVLFRTAWLTEDAYITFRPVENFVAGFGPVYNIGERVQAYTHPLWFLLQSLFFFIDLKYFGLSFPEHLYFLTIFLSIAISLLVVLLYAYRFGRTKPALVLLGLAVMACSKAFMEYSTSGLENPLSHLLLLVFFMVFFNYRGDDSRKLFLLSLLAALVAMNRFDLLLICLPALLYVWWGAGKRLLNALWAVLGFTPFILWSTFSLVYYGFIFPNTAYAKLNTGLTLFENIKSAGYYFLESLIYDPVTLVFIITVLVLVFLRLGKPAKIAAIGLVLYLLYIFYIGGDYMSGRFFSTPLIVAATLLLELELAPNRYVFGAVVLVLVLGAFIPRSPLTSPLDYGSNTTKANLLFKGIADHRAENYQFTGLLAQRKESAGSRHSGEEWTYNPRQVSYVARGPAGQQVYQWGPNVHVVDRNGLVDALIARIPKVDKHRPGHFWRVTPEGYMETLEGGENVIADPDLAYYYDHLSLVIHGPLFSRERLQEIWRFNTGYYDDYMSRYVESLPDE